MKFLCIIITLFTALGIPCVGQQIISVEIAKMDVEKIIPKVTVRITHGAGCMFIITETDINPYDLVPNKTVQLTSEKPSNITESTSTCRGCLVFIDGLEWPALPIPYFSISEMNIIERGIPPYIASVCKHFQYTKFPNRNGVYNIME